MDGFDPRTSFGYEESRRYDATDTRGDEPETVAFLARLAAGRDALEVGRYDPVTQVLDQLAPRQRLRAFLTDRGIHRCASAQPHRDMGGLQRLRHHTGQVILDRVQIHGVFQPG